MTTIPASASRWIGLMFSALALTGCTTLAESFATPSVSVTAFRALPFDGVTPRFEIALRVDNPNPIPLKLRGIDYTVNIDNRELVTGSNSSLPAVDAYGTGEFALTIVPDVAASLGLITELLRNPRDSFDYSLQAELDVGRFIPAIRLSDAGKVSLNSGR